MNIDMRDIVNSINKSCDNLGKNKIFGIPLESGDSKLLDVREGDFDEHVAMQPGAIAFFGVLRRQSERFLYNEKHSYDRWQKKKFQEARMALDSLNTGKKCTISDIESFVIINNEKEIENWEKKIEILQEQYDTFDVWYEAWKQKSYSLKEHGQTMSDERKTMPYLQMEDNKIENKSLNNSSSRIERIRQIQKQNKGE